MPPAQNRAALTRIMFSTLELARAGSLRLMYLEVLKSNKFAELCWDGLTVLWSHHPA